MTDKTDVVIAIAVSLYASRATDDASCEASLLSRRSQTKRGAYTTSWTVPFGARKGGCNWRPLDRTVREPARTSSAD